MGIESHATELAHFDVVDGAGVHHTEHGMAAASAALSQGALYAIEQEQANWYAAIAAEYRPEAEAEFAPKVIDLNAAIQAAVLDGGAR